jgi:hypothetical protein
MELRAMLAVLLPRENITTFFGDGMISMRCSHCLKTTNIHWYELLLDKILLIIAKRLYTNRDYLVRYTAMITNLFMSRTNTKTPQHPIDNVYNNYFIPNLSNLKENGTSVPHEH